MSKASFVEYFSKQKTSVLLNYVIILIWLMQMLQPSWLGSVYVALFMVNWVLKSQKVSENVLDKFFVVSNLVKFILMLYLVINMF